jgi:Flp pilus assembly protein protease CpaA
MSDNQYTVCEHLGGTGGASPAATARSHSAAGGRTAHRSRRRAWLAALLGPAVILPVWLIPWNAFGRHLPITFLGTLAAVLTCAAAVCDLGWRKIPNWATYSALAWALVANAACALAASDALAQRLGVVGLRDALLGAAAMFLGALVLFTLTGGGAGDVKLITAIGGLFGPAAGVDVVLYGFVAAGAGCVMWALWRHGPLAVLRAMGRMIGSVLLPLWVDAPTCEQGRLLRLPIPLAPFFALGTLLVLAGLSLPRYSGLLGW